MSAIYVLGFTPSLSSSNTSSSIHWAILISSHPPPTAKPVKPRSRFFHTRTATKQPPVDSILFDMHKHQLRQQPFPIPLKEESTTTTNTSSAQTTTTPPPSRTASSNSQQNSLSALAHPDPTHGSTSTSTSTDPVTTTTLNAESTQPLQLTIKILASILPQQAPAKLIPRLSQRLYTTPTYGPEDDWLRNALSAMYEGARGALLEPGFDVDQFVEYAVDAAKEYVMYQPASSEREPREKGLLELDYAAHIARNADVKALLSQQQQQYPTPPQSPHMETEVKAKKARGWLGFRVSASPGARARPAVERYSFERQDDPYGGLM